VKKTPAQQPGNTFNIACAFIDMVLLKITGPGVLTRAHATVLEKVQVSTRRPMAESLAQQSGS